MSYTIYKSLKINDNFELECEAAESNVYDYNGKRIYSKYKTQLDTSNGCTKRELLLYMILCSVFNGDMFYQSDKRKLKTLAGQFLKDKGIDMSTFITQATKDSEYLRMIIRQFDLYTKEYKEKMRNVGNKTYIVKIGIPGSSSYVRRKTKTLIYTTAYADSAKRYKKSIPELEDMFKSFTNHNITFLEV